MTTLPARVVLSIVADVLNARIRRLGNRAEHNPRAQSDSKRAGRLRDRDDLIAQRDQL